MMVRSVSFPGRAYQSFEEVDAAGHRLAEFVQMLSKGELPLMPDIQEKLEGIAEHLFSINGDVGLLSRFCIVQADDGCLAFG